MKKILLFALMLCASLGLAAQDWSMQPHFGDVELSAGFMPDPYTIDIISGGTLDLSESTEIDDVFAYGYISDAPDLDFYYDGNGTTNLTIAVIGYGEDSVLLINGPDGLWYFDDDSAGDFDPMINFLGAAGGLYSIWVGSLYSDDYLDVTLLISEF